MSNNLIGSTSATFTVALSAAVTEPVDVAWSTRDGTAKAGTDYEAANGVVTFLPGETAKQVNVTVYGQEDLTALDKNFFIELLPPSNAVLGMKFIEVVITIDNEDGVAVLSLVVPQGKRGIKGDPGLSAYEHAVLMGYDGTVEQWFNEIASASQAAERAESFAADAAESVAQITTVVGQAVSDATAQAQGFAEDAAGSAEISTQKATEATSAVASTKQYVDGALSDLSTAANKFYQTLPLANADIENIAVNQPVTVGDAVNGGLWYKATAEATTLTKSAYDPLTQAKDYVKNTGEASIVGPALSNIDYVTATRTLEFKNSLFVVSGTSRYQLTTPQSVALPSNAPYRIEYTVSTGLISAVAYNAGRTEGNVVIGFVTASANTLKSSDFAFTVDGVELYASENGKLINKVASRINFDNTSKSLKMTAGNIAIASPSFSLVIPTAVDLLYPSTSGDYKLSFNRNTKAFSFIRSSEPQSALSQIDLAIVSINSSLNVTSVVGVDSFTVDGAVSLPPQNGELLTDIPSRIAFDTINSLLTIAGGVRIKSLQFTTYAGTEAKTVSIPTANGIYKLQYDIKTGIFSFVSSAAVQASDIIALGTIYVGTSSLKVTGITNYTVDGLVNGQPIEGKLLGVKTGHLIATANSEINFDFVNKQVIITASRVRLVATSSIPELLPAVTLDISGDESYIKRLMYDVKTKTFRAIRANALSTEDEVQVALFCVNTKFVDGVPYYQIDGLDPAGKKDDLAIAKFTVPYGDLTANYEQADLPAFAQLHTGTAGDHIKVYDLYDALMTAHPEYITKTLLGTDGIGNNIYQYQFTTPEVPTVSASFSKKPKIVAISGVHGYEPTGIYNLFYALKQIVESWNTDKGLEALYWGVNFIVVPIANPSGFDAVTRENHNGVDIARNFPAQWSAAQPNSGGSPLSQAETVILDAVMSNNKDAIYCFSHHNFHTPSGYFIWNASGSDFGVNLAKMLIIGQTIRAKNRYPLMMPQSNDYYVGYANKGTPPGSEGLQAQSYGIQAGTFEICNRWEWEDGQPVNSSIVATMGVETLINWLLLNVKYACDLYNSKVNL